MLPTPIFSGPAEPAQTSDETICDQRERPGVHAFIRFVTKHQGGIVGRTIGPCGGTSGHASGRAWDWMIRADVPDERARADELIGWLLANGAELYRRAGLAYIIWDRKIWSSLHPNWRPYDGYDESGNCTRGSCRDPHISHVHFSFTPAGADGKTSFYQWLAEGEPGQPIPRPSGNGAPSPRSTTSLGLRIAPAAVAFAVGLGGMLLFRKHWQ